MALIQHLTIRPLSPADKQSPYAHTLYMLLQRKLLGATLAMDWQFLTADVGSPRVSCLNSLTKWSAPASPKSISLFKSKIKPPFE